MLFPMFVAGLEVSAIKENPQWQTTIRKCAKSSHQSDILLGLLEEMWDRSDPDVDVNGLAREKGIEMGLL